MFNIKKQINRLYLSEIFGQLSLAGAWVAILASRGFSLPQIGFAETIFHIVSILFEIPSGVLADVFGRKKTLIISALMRMLGDIVMICSNNFAMVCISIGLNALCYNFASGSEDALAYDSLKSVGQEEKFDRYASSQLVIYRVCEGLSTLTAGFALVVGYKIAYATGVFASTVQLAILFGLVEVRLSPLPREFNVWRKIASCFRQSFLFLKEARKALLLMFSNSFVGALDILLLFFLQAKLPMAGIPAWALGLALLTTQAGGIVGARLILCVRKLRYRMIFTISTAMILSGILLEHTGLYLLMMLGGFLASMADDALQVSTNTRLQDMFPSEQRATLISIESFTFSCIMIVLSPLAGLFFSCW